MTARKVDQTFVYTIEDTDKRVIVVLPDEVSAPDLLRPEDFDTNTLQAAWLFDVEATAVLRRNLTPKG